VAVQPTGQAGDICTLDAGCAEGLSCDPLSLTCVDVDAGASAEPLDATPWQFDAAIGDVAVHPDDAAGDALVQSDDAAGDAQSDVAQIVPDAEADVVAPGNAGAACTSAAQCNVGLQCAANICAPDPGWNGGGE
jgi:hypothetical protein